MSHPAQVCAGGSVGPDRRGRCRFRLGSQPPHGPAGPAGAVDHSAQRRAADRQAGTHTSSSPDATAISTQSGQEVLRPAMAGGDGQLHDQTESRIGVACSQRQAKINGATPTGHHSQPHDSDECLRIETEQTGPDFNTGSTGRSRIEAHVLRQKGGVRLQREGTHKDWLSSQADQPDIRLHGTAWDALSRQPQPAICGIVHIL